MADRRLHDRCQEMWHNSSPFSALLPLTFSNGQTLNDFPACCPHCKKAVGDEALRGVVRNPIRDVYTFEGFVGCYDCKNLTPYSYRFTLANGAITTKRIPVDMGFVKAEVRPFPERFSKATAVIRRVGRVRCREVEEQAGLHVAGKDSSTKAG